MKKHPMAGIAVKIEDGPFKGQYFKVVDYLVNQYQGKDIEKIASSKAQLVTPVVGRGYPLDDNIVFGQLYPAMTFMCVHDQELKIKTAKPPLKIVEGGDNDEHTSENSAIGSGTTSEGDNPVAGTEPAESDGRSTSSAAASSEDGSDSDEDAKTEPSSGSGSSGVEKESASTGKRKTKTDKR